MGDHGVTAESAPTGFSAEWLALREPADTRARSSELTAQLAERVQLNPSTRFVDLACGTGANLRYLAPRVGGSRQQWLLVDSDAALLARVELVRAEGAGVELARAEGACFGEAALSGNAAGAADRRVKTLRLDLSTGLHALDLAPDVVVTASALLDLVSDRWLMHLVERCRTNRCTVLFALSYDGRIALTPSDPDDEWIRDLVNRHQLGDKGFGPALGPGASQRTRELLEAAGYHVRTARSDWHLLPNERLLQQALLEGWAAAAAELVPNDADRCSAWLARRRAHVANESSHITVGHEDALAWPHD